MRHCRAKHATAHHHTSHCITWHDTTQAITSHQIKCDHHITWHDMTWHATSQLTTVAHPTSPHNQPHYFISPRSNFMTSKQVTSPPRNSRRRLVHIKEMVWASRWSVALRTFYRQILSLLYSSFFFWNFRSRLARELLVQNQSKHLILHRKTQVFLTSSHPNMTCVCEKRPCSESRKLIFFHIKTEFQASAGMNVDRHLLFRVDATPIGTALRSTLNKEALTGLDMCKVCTEAVHCIALWTRTLSQVWTCVKYVPKQSIA